MPKGALRNIAIAGGLVMTSLFLTGLLAELAFRLKAYWSPLHLSEFLIPDTQLGWRARPHMDSRYPVMDAAGQSREVWYRTDGQGSRHFKQTDPDRLRILVVGDSFTMAKDVSQGETYYDRLAAALEADLAAFGADGYASLQELLLLEEHLDSFQPDLIVWQCCENDFIGNLLELGQASAKNRCGVMQPYLDNHQSIVYANPDLGPMARAVQAWPFAALRAVAYRVDLLRYAKPTLENGVENKLDTLGLAYPPLREAVSVTGMIFERAKSVVADRPVIVFTTNGKAPYQESFRQLSAQYGFFFVEEVAQELESAHAQGEVIFAADQAHWNAAGHAIVGKALARFVQEKSLANAP